MGFEEWVESGDVIEITGWSGAVAALAFWGLGRWRPLAAPLGRIIPTALTAWVVLILLARFSAGTAWLTDTMAVAAWLAASVSAGYLPFRLGRA